MAQTVARTKKELIAEFLDLDWRYSDLLKNYSREQLAWQPAQGVWCVAECIEHVARTNYAYLTPIKTAIATAAGSSAHEDRPLRTGGWPSTLFLRCVSPEGKTKLKAPRVVRPSSAGTREPVDAQKALANLLDTHQQLRELLSSESQPDLNRLRFKNPFVLFVRFTVATGFLIVAGHGRRHLLQAQRLCSLPGFPGIAA